ncbi:uncharacterized protein [Antedon mediterranea]|uniref:uncharacterized protein isoform X2 n=1 Tax=Antedon mediterranea TaxID=105859 RepID=UPI003AF6BCF5
MSSKLSFQLLVVIFLVPVVLCFYAESVFGKNIEKIIPERGGGGFGIEEHGSRIRRDGEIFQGRGGQKGVNRIEEHGSRIRRDGEIFQGRGGQKGVNRIEHGSRIRRDGEIFPIGGIGVGRIGEGYGIDGN